MLATWDISQGQLIDIVKLSQLIMHSIASGPSHAAYTWTAQGGGFGNQTVVDKVPSEMLHMVDAHWYQFPPMNPLWHALLGFVIGVLGTISVTGNGMVIYIFTTTKNLRTPSNLLVINLAISDFLMMLCMSPVMVCISFRNRLRENILKRKRNDLLNRFN